MAKYDRKTRDKVRAAISKLMEQGLKNREIAERLNDKGFTSPSGGPMTGDVVASPDDDDSEVMIELILNADHLSDSRKIRILKDMIGRTPL